MPMPRLALLLVSSLVALERVAARRRHRFKLELLGQSVPFGRASNGTFTVTVTDLDLRLPVLETPDGGVVR